METGMGPAAATGVEWVEIRLKGYLDERWAEYFDGLEIAHDRAGTTRLAGPLADQAALYGVLNRLRDLGIALVSVHWFGEEAAPRANLQRSQS